MEQQKGKFIPSKIIERLQAPTMSKPNAIKDLILTAIGQVLIANDIKLEAIGEVSASLKTDGVSRFIEVRIKL